MIKQVSSTALSQLVTAVWILVAFESVLYAEKSPALQGVVLRKAVGTAVSRPYAMLSYLNAPFRAGDFLLRGAPACKNA